MKIHEYQAKNIMREFGIPVSYGDVAETVDEGMLIADRLFTEGATRVFIKAQVHAGGRGKAGGIAGVKSLDEAKEALNRILGMTLVTPQTGEAGRIVRKVLLVDGSDDIGQELYFSVVLDRQHECPVILASAEGGVEIEHLAETHPEKIFKVEIDPAIGVQEYQLRNLMFDLGLGKEVSKELKTVFRKLVAMFLERDCSQLEINPLAIMEDGTVCLIDAKVSLDESAFYKHQSHAALRDPGEESELEVRASEYDLNYVKLDGEIGCMVNGAGLAMTTMDIIHYFGGEPANFLDVGGGANSKMVAEAFKILLEDKNVKAVLINIFGGIVRCDRVAKGVIEAVKEIDLNRPLVVRLAGTNSKEGLKMLQESGLKLETATSLSDAAKRVVQLAEERI